MLAKNTCFTVHLWYKIFTKIRSVVANRQSTKLMPGETTSWVVVVVIIVIVIVIIIVLVTVICTFLSCHKVITLEAVEGGGELCDESDQTIIW